MPDKSQQPSKSRLVLVATGVSLLLLAIVLIARYRSYVFTIAWHSVHRSDVGIVGHEVILPQWWWKEDSPDYDTYLLRRACSSSTFPEPEIVVRPALSGTIRQSDQDVANSLQKLITARQNKPLAGVRSSLVVIKTRQGLLYCEKAESTLFGIDLDSHLSCQGAKLTHTFTYDGVPIYEHESESILNSFQ